METKELNLFMNREAAIAEAGEILKNGGIVAIPTETVYGLAADAFNPEAVAKIFEAKGRPQDNPVIVHIASREQLPQVVSSVPEKADGCILAGSADLGAAKERSRSCRCLCRIANSSSAPAKG